MDYKKWSLGSNWKGIIMGVFLKGGLKTQSQNQPEISAPSQVNQSESYVDAAKRIGSGILGSAAQGAENILELPGRALSTGLGAAGVDLANLKPSQPELQNQQPNPQAPFDVTKFRQIHGQEAGVPIKERVAKGLGYENLEPQNFGEKLIQGVAEDLPLLLTGPGGLLAKTGSSVASNLGSKAVEHIGFGPLMQFAAGLGTQGIARYLTKSGFGKLRRAATDQMKTSFKNFDKASSKIVVDSSPLETALDSVRQQVDKLSPDTGEAVTKNINNFGKDIQAGRSKLSDIRNAQSRIGDTLSETMSPKVRAIYKKLYGDFTGFIDQEASKIPEISQDWTKARELYKGINGTSALRNALEESTNLKKLIASPIAKGLIGTGGVYSLATRGLSALPAAGIGLTKAAGVTYGLRTLNRIFDFAKNPETRKLYSEALENAFLGDKTALANNLKNLNKLAQDYEKGD